MKYTMFFKNLNLYYNTLKHVKPTQLYHQVYYRLKNRLTNKAYIDTPSRVVQLNLKKGILYQNSYLGNNSFTFLNLDQELSEIAWNFSEYGKLWTYNLNYFEFLHQEEMTKEEGLRLIRNYITVGDSLKDGLEPYPIALRGINWIKFLAEYQIQDEEISSFLFRDYLRLADNLEYHLLANHLLENGLSLLFGAYYFQDEKLYKKAKKILKSELREQILSDGAHYELSPMYHQIILHRVLDCYNLVQNNFWKEKELLLLLEEKAELMLGWLGEIIFRNGEIPRLNDAADGIAPTTEQLFAYAEKLGLKKRKIELSDSGYRKFTDEKFEAIIDVGQIAPSYQPGHSHADSLQFVLHYKGNPIIVDTGISTYEKNEQRQLERSTCSHNTITINHLNSSNVWGGFRVAERAHVSIHKESKELIEASHNGYRKCGITHKRSFNFASGELEIKDDLQGKAKNTKAEGHLHFHPDVQLEIIDNRIIINENIHLKISGATEIRLEEYQFAAGLNKLQTATKLVYQFNNKATIFFHATSATVNAATAAQSLSR
ncbi:alginate lyase family protein [Salinimicrobium tongyeongense]|uniref:Alginate lyase family protein n=1 Tax=Salinimicrobium tongyeongense TaxID=2809707 RepID=A0ABY6NQ22_9FLAO|nr:alginate lyase family protein [Salinimicrobium tongyeongense]UZH54643.1 alginate lyase family protein [Salinimicrobium tongyeongense]